MRGLVKNARPGSLAVRLRIPVSAVFEATSTDCEQTNLEAAARARTGASKTCTETKRLSWPDQWLPRRAPLGAPRLASKYGVQLLR